MIYVLTVNMDGFDNLRPPAVPEDTFVKYLCFTNVPNLPRVTPWEYRPIYPVGSGARSSRLPKIMPHLVLPSDAEFSIYHDGNFQLRRDPTRIVEQLLQEHDWAVHRHPGRDCLYDEARVILEHHDMEGWRILKGPEVVEQIRNQAARYQAADFPAHAGLWANGFIVRKHTPEVARLNELWWEEFSNGSERDQLSFPVARCRAGMEIHSLPGNIFASPWLVKRWHAAWRTREDNPDHWKARDELRGRLARLQELTGSDGGIHFASY